MKKIPLILDCDPGLDDSIAIMLANASDKIDLLALCPVAGNVPYKFTSKNACTLAGYCHSDAIVARGASRPLLFIPTMDASDAHGNNGLGGAEIENRKGVTLSDRFAWDVMYEMALKYSGELVIAAVGPLTNVATAILKYPDLKDHVKKIQVMGGAITQGNMSAYAEFNIWFDPHACEIVLHSGIPVTLCGLDCTRPATLTTDELREICAGESKISDLIAAYTAFADGHGGNCTIHDAITVAGLIDDTLFQEKPYYVCCETRGENAGQTVVDFRNRWGKEPNCNIAFGADKEKFKSILREMVQSYR